ncbi:MAG TPA: small, acid-soluble spore protein, alpha/beta type [Firmicutes bacterium]|jgi:small acid-soluble spore protein F (minor alpha/beta-type SASP)|nr:small, acid-soluble spore protein, alpha/beta type [Bacillota bacterium]
MPGRLRLKEEAAAKLGLLDEINNKGWGSLSSRETGKIGGLISKKLKLEGTRKK